MALDLQLAQQEEPMWNIHVTRLSLIPWLFIAGALTAHVGCATTSPTDDRSPNVLAPPSSQATELDPEQAQSLRNLADKVFGITWSGRVLAVSDRGFHILTDQVTTLSYRPTGNAFFLHQSNASLSHPAFEGSDSDYIERGKAVLAGLGIEASEIAEAKLLQHFVQVGVVDTNGKDVRVESPKKDRRTLLLTRAVRGIPVFNSRLIMDLDRKGHIASLEITWPNISPKVMEQVQVLQNAARGDFRAPEQKFAELEAVEVGIVHSPAASFLDEQTAAIRVIYRPKDPRLGKKAVAYLDAAGKPVTMPRTMVTREAPVPSRTPHPQQ
jgi:hypothetical protein